MSNSTHADEARLFVNDAEKRSEGGVGVLADVNARLAHVHATLALVDEQRTANQLAYAALLPESSPTRQRILDEVGARLDAS